MSSATQPPMPTLVRGLSLSNAEPCVRLYLNRLSRSLRAFQRSSEVENRLEILDQLQEETGEVLDLFRVLRVPLPRSITLSLSNLLAALASNLDNANASSVRTAARALDFLSRYTASEFFFSSFADRPLQVLGIDDNEVCRETLKLALQTRELELTLCASGEEALGVLDPTRFELVLADIMMPRMDGFEFVSALREVPGYAEVPLIFVTVLSDFETRSKSIVKGCVDLIAKPFIPSEVVLKTLTVGWGARLDHYSGRSAAAVGFSSAAVPDTAADISVESLRGILCMEPNGRIRTANEDCCRIFGHPPAALAGQHLLHLLPASLQSDEHARHLTDVLAGRAKPTASLLLAGLHKNSQRMPLLVNFSETTLHGRRLLVALVRQSAPAQPALKPMPAPVM